MAKRMRDEGERCVDNERFAFADDQPGMEHYNKVRKSGCCGFFDEDILIAGRPAKIGCNFGH